MIRRLRRKFSNLYNPDIQPKPCIQGIDWCPISTRDGEELAAPFTWEEIRKAF